MAAPNLRILYSKDDPDSREIVCLLLAKEGFETICPDSSQDVLRIASEQKFDAYLLDSWTPDMSGVELCKRIKEFDAHTPIIFYSAAAFGFAATAQIDGLFGSYQLMSGGLEHRRFQQLI